VPPPISLHDHDTPGRHPQLSADGTATAASACTCPADRAATPAAAPRPAAPASAGPPDLSPKQRAVVDALRAEGLPLKATQIAARAQLEYDGTFRGVQPPARPDDLTPTQEAILDVLGEAGRR
jgi:hypothetical protein